MSKLLTYLLFVALMTEACAYRDNNAHFMPAKPTEADVCGNWIGWADGMDDLFLYRITLSTNGGVFEQDYIGRVSVLRISRWELHGYKLTIVLEGSGSNDIENVSGNVRYPVIDCRVKGRHWQHAVTFHSEARLEDRLSTLRRLQQM